MKLLLKSFAIAALMGVLLGCGQVPSIMDDTEAIATIDRQKAGNIAKFRGTVTEVAPFLKGGAYLLTDDSGEIWAIAAAQLPEVGEQLKVEGEIVYAKIAIAEQEFGEVYLNEIQRFGEVSRE
jgi:hypothetical protein